MKPTLQLRLSAHLALTPQLQQSIRLLQLSTLELSQELDTILTENPMLERLDDPLDLAMRIGPDGILQSGTVGPSPDPVPEAMDRNSDGQSDDFAGGDSAVNNEGGDGESAGDGPQDSADWGADNMTASQKDNQDDENQSQQMGDSGTTLRDHLMEQLTGTQASNIDRALVTILIDNLTADGYLDITLDEVVAMLPPELELELDDVQTALSMLQSFDPTGVGARDHSESFQLQIRALPQGEWPADVTGFAMRIVQNHLLLLAARDFTRLRAQLGCDDYCLKEAQDLIRSLNPRPGSGFASTGMTYVTPDVIVKKVRNEWRAQLNPDVMPKIRVNETFARMMSANRGSAKTLTGHLQEARWLVKNVQQRFETILRVSQAIVDRQKAFFTHGALAMRPLVLREIAEELGLHESTISRVTTQKYMLTQFGTLELKYFFGSHVGTEAGGAASSTAIRALIKQIIQAEETSKPLSDSRIAEMLSEQGFVVARRTVAKYREAMEIPAVAQRKCLQ